MPKSSRASSSVMDSRSSAIDASRCARAFAARRRMSSTESQRAARALASASGSCGESGHVVHSASLTTSRSGAGRQGELVEHLTVNLYRRSTNRFAGDRRAQLSAVSDCGVHQEPWVALDRFGGGLRRIDMESIGEMQDKRWPLFHRHSLRRVR